MPDYLPIAILTVTGLGFAALSLGVSWLLRPKAPRPEKLTTYECGERPIGQAWSQFNVRYYIYALIFVVFDVETVFLFPWAVRLRYFTQELHLGAIMFVEMLVFILILVLGLAYAWRKGVLKWI
jgi:NADH:ubiquinone oxidoreductase subunit 3 (subunit A)